MNIHQPERTGGRVNVVLEKVTEDSGYPRGGGIYYIHVGLMANVCADVASRTIPFKNGKPFYSQRWIGASRSSSVVQLSRTDSVRVFAVAVRTMTNCLLSVVTS